MAHDVLSEVTPDSLRRYSAAVFPRFALLAALQLGIFTHLKDGPMRPDDIARGLGVDASRLRRLLYGLVRTGLVRVEDGRFANAPGADQFLVRGRPGYMGSIHELWSDLWTAALQSADSIRVGSALAAHDFSSMSQADLASFLRGTHVGALAAGEALAGALHLGQHRHLVDVGGGSGGVAIGACRMAPQLRATIIDFPTVTPITAGFVEEEGMTERIDVRPVDITQEPPSGSFDVAVMRNLIQTMSSARRRAPAAMSVLPCLRVAQFTLSAPCWTIPGSALPHRWTSTSSSSTSTKKGPHSRRANIAHGSRPRGSRIFGAHRRRPGQGRPGSA